MPRLIVIYNFPQNASIFSLVFILSFTLKIIFFQQVLLNYSSPPFLSLFFSSVHEICLLFLCFIENSAKNAQEILKFCASMEPIVSSTLSFSFSLLQLHLLVLLITLLPNTTLSPSLSLLSHRTA